jgi:hypothetical protein
VSYNKGKIAHSLKYISQKLNGVYNYNTEELIMILDIADMGHFYLYGRTVSSYRLYKYFNGNNERIKLIKECAENCTDEVINFNLFSMTDIDVLDNVISQFEFYKLEGYW